MNLTYLRSFYETVNCNSISCAAKNLHLTQPGLSRQLKGLESEFEVILLDRTNKGIELTESGKVVYDYAKTLLSLEENMKRDLEKLTNDDKALSLLCCKNLGEYILPCSIYTFKEIYYNIDVNMAAHDSSTVLNQVRNHETNLGIIHTLEMPDDIVASPILNDQLILVGGPNACDEIELHELLTLPLILREDGSGTRAQLESALIDQGLNINHLNVVITLNSPESIKSSVKSGRGYTFIPEKVVMHEIHNGTLKKIKIKNCSIPFRYQLIHRKNYTLSDAEVSFVNFLTSKGNCFCY